MGLVSAAHSGWTQPDETVALAQMPKLAIYSEEVTVDGQPKPEIGRAVADSMAAHLLKRGQVRVFNLGSAAMASQPGMLASRASSSAVQRLMDRDLDYLVTFNVFSTASNHLVTVKKMRAQTHEIIEAHQFSTFGSVEQVFRTMPNIVDRIDPLPRRTVFPITQSPSELRPRVVEMQRRALPSPPQRLSSVVVEADRGYRP
jgi:hypothetical protein